MKKYVTLLLLLGAALAAAASEGILCLTFDDRSFASWERAMPLFEKYDARATFFICGKIDAKALATMKKLQNAGHSIGLHGLHHVRSADYLQKHGAKAFLKKEITPQLEICRKNGIQIRAFAYPFSQRSPDTDRALFTVFDFLRTGWFSVRKNDAALVDIDECFVKKTASKQLFYGFPCSGRFDMAAVKAAMKRAAAEKSVLVFYAHNITGTLRPSHHIAVSQLNAVLEYAKTIGLAVRGLNEL